MEASETTLLLVRLRSLTSSGAARAIRQAAHLSLGDVAAHVGVPASTISRWERGDGREGSRQPRASAEALRYARLLDELLENGARRPA